MRYFLLICFLSTLVAAPLRLSAQEETATVADSLAPRFTPDTIAVAKIVLPGADVPELMRILLGPFAPGGSPNNDFVSHRLLNVLEVFSQLELAGATDIYVICNGGKKRLGSTAVVARCDQDGNVERNCDETRWPLQALFSLLNPDLHLDPDDVDIEVRQGVLLAHNPAIGPGMLAETLTRQVSLKKKFSPLTRMPLQILVVPSVDQRPVMRELFLGLPPQFVEADFAKSALDFQWLVIGLEPEDSQPVQIIAQAKDAHTANHAAKDFPRVLDSLTADPEMIRQLEFIDVCESLKQFQIKVNGSQFAITLDNENAHYDEFRRRVPRLQMAPYLEAGRRNQLSDQFKKIWIGVFRHIRKVQGKTGPFPDAASRDAEGNSLLSWRVHLLPHLNQSELYQQFHLDEPWDSTHNRTLIEKMPEVYSMVRSPASCQGKTCFQIPIGDDTLFPQGRGLTFEDVADGLSNTIMLVEVDEKHAVPWTQPSDWQFDPEKDVASELGGHLLDDQLIMVLYADGGTRAVSKSIDSEALRGMFTRSGGELSSK